MKTLDNLYWRVKFGLMNWVENFLTDEEGDSNLVSIIVLIVIILAVAAIFKGGLEQAIKDVFLKLTTFISTGP
nr:Flp1 family type IVb pilin [uncultured Schaedlerella sp.]